MISLENFHRSKRFSGRLRGDPEPLTLTRHREVARPAPRPGAAWAAAGEGVAWPCGAAWGARPRLAGPARPLLLKDAGEAVRLAELPQKAVREAPPSPAREPLPRLGPGQQGLAWAVLPRPPPLGGTAWPGKRFPPAPPPGSTSKNQREPHWTRPTGKSGVTQRGLGRSLHHCSHGTRVGGAPHAEPVDRHCLALQTKCPARGRLAHDTKSREDYGVSDRGRSTNAAANRCRSHRTRVLRRAP